MSDHSDCPDCGESHRRSYDSPVLCDVCCASARVWKLVEDIVAPLRRAMHQSNDRFEVLVEETVSRLARDRFVLAGEDALGVATSPDLMHRMVRAARFAQGQRGLDLDDMVTDENEEHLDDTLRAALTAAIRVGGQAGWDLPDPEQVAERERLEQTITVLRDQFGDAARVVFDVGQALADAGYLFYPDPAHADGRVILAQHRHGRVILAQHRPHGELANCVRELAQFRDDANARAAELEERCARAERERADAIARQDTSASVLFDVGQALMAARYFDPLKPGEVPDENNVIAGHPKSHKHFASCIHNLGAERDRAVGDASSAWDKAEEAWDKVEDLEATLVQREALIAEMKGQAQPNGEMDWLLERDDIRAILIDAGLLSCAPYAVLPFGDVRSAVQSALADLRAARAEAADRTACAAEFEEWAARLQREVSAVDDIGEVLMGAGYAFEDDDGPDRPPRPSEMAGCVRDLITSGRTRQEDDSRYAIQLEERLNKASADIADRDAIIVRLSVELHRAQTQKSEVTHG